MSNSERAIFLATTSPSGAAALPFGWFAVGTLGPPWPASSGVAGFAFGFAAGGATTLALGLPCSTTFSAGLAFGFAAAGFWTTPPAPGEVELSILTLDVTLRGGQGGRAAGSVALAFLCLPPLASFLAAFFAAPLPGASTSGDVALRPERAAWREN